MTSAEAVTDIQDALNAGFDGFALNTHTISSSDSWNTDALDYLFAAASGTSFKLFISFDMSWGLDVSQLAAFLAPYASQSAYYKVSGQAFVSTYTGGTISNSQWDSGFIQPLISTYGITPFFVPDFDDFSGYPTGVFSSYPILNGVFSWESAWPSPGNTPANVSDSIDSAALQEARAAGKIYMMRKSNTISTAHSIKLTISYSSILLPVQVPRKWPRLVPYRRSQSARAHGPDSAAAA
jgi:glucan endo-1,3-alpha-glucosidase